MSFSQADKAVPSSNKSEDQIVTYGRERIFWMMTLPSENLSEKNRFFGIRYRNCGSHTAIEEYALQNG